jgi:hypothetical protein
MASAYAVEEVPTFKAKVGELKKITFKLTNNQSKEQPFVYIIVVKTEEDFTEQLSWVNGVFQAGQEFRPQQSWIPEKVGEYTVEIFVWQDLDNPGPLSSPLTMKVIVEP